MISTVVKNAHTRLPVTGVPGTGLNKSTQPGKPFAPHVVSAHARVPQRNVKTL